MAVYDIDTMRRLNVYRVAQNEPSASPGRSFGEKTATVRRSAAGVFNVKEAAQKLISTGGGVSPGRDFKTVTRKIEEPSSNSLASPSGPLYRLPSPSGRDISANMFRFKSLPSGAKGSPSETSPSQSTSSRQSLGPRRSTSVPVKDRRSNVKSSEAAEIRSHFPKKGEITEVRHYFEPYLEFNDDIGNASSTTTTKRSSLGPPMRVKSNEKVSSSSAKKKTSKVVDSSNNLQDGGASAEKTVQTTHPILEKLRKSWWSALRVKQRQEAESALSNSRSDSSDEQLSGELKGNGTVLAAHRQWEQAHNVAQSEFSKSGQIGSPNRTAQALRTDREVLIRNIVTRERRAVINQHHLQLTTDAPESPRRSDSSGSFATERSNQTLPESKEDVGASNATKEGLAKAQANLQRSKTDVQSKFKKQYVHETMGVNKSLSMQRGNKENMQFDMKVKGQTSPPSRDAGLKRKPAVPRRQLSPRQLGTALNGVRSVPQTPARENLRPLPSLRPVNESSPYAKRRVDLTKSDTFVSSSTRTVGFKEPADTSGKSQQPVSLFSH
jgi:hypothetical protein